MCACKNNNWLNATDLYLEHDVKCTSPPKKYRGINSTTKLKSTCKNSGTFDRKEISPEKGTMGSLAPNPSTGAQLPCSKVHWYIVGGGQFVKQLIMSKECSQGLTMTSLDPEGDTLTEISAHNVLKYNKMVVLVYEWYIFFSRLSLAGLYQRKMEKENFLTLCLVDWR